MSLLSEEKIEALWQEHVLPGFSDQQKLISPTVFARAIEAAVLEAQNKQEPVAWAYTINSTHSVFSAENPPEDAYDEGTLYPLFAAPVVPDGMVMVPREAFDRLSSTGEECEFNDMASMCFPLDEWSDFEAMIAAAEEKP